MKSLTRSILSLLLILVLVLSSFVPSYASDTETLTYSTEYNSGTREAVCTTLDGTSAASYYENYSYDTLSQLSSDDLFDSLQTLMRETHSYTSSYDDCHYKADRTDCQNCDGSVSLIYTSYSATMNQWNGWNREHVWPKSLGGDSTTGGGADLHHIRPSDAGVNSSRGNKPYGEVGDDATEKYGTNPAEGILGGTYNSTYFEPLDNVKGDVARICLYVYVRWYSDWGATDVTAVFESVDILLEWCEMDPVDTWEMGRNEVVQEIQGNRNVFIDYPEYAWLLFGKEVPSDMVTPSGEASGGTLSGGSSSGSSSACLHANQTTTTVNATCTTAGSVTVTCDDCGATVSKTTVSATGHSYSDGVCSVCGAEQGDSTTASGSIADYADTNGWSNSTQYTTLNLDDNITVTVSGGSNSGKYYESGEDWRIYQSESGTFTVSVQDGYTISSVKVTYTIANTGVLTYNGSSVTSGTAVDVNASSATFSVGNTGSATNGQVRITNIEVVYEQTSSSDAECEHTNQTTTTVDATCTTAGSVTVTCDDCGITVSTSTISATGHQNTATVTVDATCTAAGSVTVTCNDCGITVSTSTISATGHQNTATVTVDATCTATGSVTVICNDCGITVSTSTISATGHSYSDGVCENCGAAQPESTPEYTFIHPEGSSAGAAYSVTIPGAPTLIGDYTKDYVFVGWATSAVDDTDTLPQVYAEGEVVAISEDTVFYALYSYQVEEEGSVSGFIKKELSEINSTDVVVITVTTSDGTVYALHNGNGASEAPTAVTVTVSGAQLSGTVDDTIKWNITNDSGNLTIYPNGTTATWLYCTSANNGVRVGTNANNAFTIDSSSGYLKNTATSRYLGVYTTNPDWRCYTTSTTNIANQTLGFYVEVAPTQTTYYTTELLYNCKHADTTTTTVNATCTDSGSVTVICNDCGVTLSSEVIYAFGHSYIDGVCIRCGESEDNTDSEYTSEGWYLVTDVSGLQAGDKIIIVSGTFVAGDISSNIMASVDGISSSDGLITSLPDGAVILTLGGSEGAWTLADDSGQLLGATAVKKLAWDNGTTTWSISISDGSGTIQSTTDSYGRLLYNVNSPRFTTYTSSTNTSMLLPQIYKYVEADAGESGTRIESASMTIGSTLAINYYVADCDENANYYMQFIMNGQVYDPVYGTVNGERLVFTFTNIPPQFMGDNISASLYEEGNETPIDTVETFSVKAYAEKVINLYSNDEELMNLIADMLLYGRAAQLYKSYKTGELVTDGLEISVSGFDITAKGSDALPTDDDNDRSLTPSGDVSELTDSFTAVGVRFDFDNKIYFKFKTDDLTKIKITVDGNEITDLTSKVTLTDGVYVFYTEGVSATEFDRVFTFEMYVNGELHQTLTYSANSYAYAKCGDLTATDETALSYLAQLVRALYRYGISAKAYRY